MTGPTFRVSPHLETRFNSPTGRVPRRGTQDGGYRLSPNQQPYDEALGKLRQWFDSHRPSPDVEPNTNVMCAGLAVLERMRRAYPLKRADYVTPGNQVRTSGSLIQSILERNGEERRFTREGGRTTRATVPAAEGLVEELNEVVALAGLSDEDRGQVIDELQVWLVARVGDYLDQQAMEVEVDLSKPSTQIVADMLAAGPTRLVPSPSIWWEPNSTFDTPISR